MRLPFVSRRRNKARRRPPPVFTPAISRRSAFRSFKLPGLVLAFSCLLLGFYLILPSKVLTVGSVRCSAAVGPFYDSSRWCRLFEEKVMGKNMLTADLSRAAREMKKEVPAIEDIRIKKVPWRALRITIKGRSPLAVVGFYETAATASAAAVLRDKFLVDENGLVFMEAAVTAGLPLLVYEGQSLGLGERLSSGRLGFCLEALRLLKSSKIAVVRLWEEGGAVSLLVRDGPTVLISSDKNVSEQISALRLILEKYKIEGKSLNLVDLRFKKPVVRYD